MEHITSNLRVVQKKNRASDWFYKNNYYNKGGETLVMDMITEPKSNSRTLKSLLYSNVMEELKALTLARIQRCFQKKQ